MSNRIPVCATDDVGSALALVYVAGTQILASKSTLGNATTPVYVNNGVLTACSALAPLASPAFTGTPTAPTPTDGSTSTAIVNKAYVSTQLSNLSTTLSNQITALSNEITVVQATTEGNLIGTVRGVALYSGPVGGGGGGGSSSSDTPILMPVWLDYISSSNAWVYSPVEDKWQYKSEALNAKIFSHIITDLLGSSVTDATDTYTTSGGSTVEINYKLAEDGHKIICVDSSSSATVMDNLSMLLNDANIGSAWYYLYNEADGTLILPRTRYGFHGDLQPVKATFNAEHKMYLHFYGGVS